MIFRSSWLPRLLLLLFVLLLANNAAKDVGMKKSVMLSDWPNPKFKEVTLPLGVKEKFWRLDEIAPRYGSLATRKEYHTLTEEELTRYHDCLKRMKYDPYLGKSGVTEYNMFVYIHRNASAPAAHGGPAFLPFHREFLKRYEMSLQNCHPKAFLPYWDSSLESYLPDPSQSAIFSDGYLGSSFGVVNTGFMANWEAVPEDCQEFGREVRRECGNDGSLLVTDDKVERFLKKKSFAEAVTPFDPTFENDHGDVHAYFAGHMMSLTCAPNDPIFFMHHAYIDYCFEKFKELHPGSDDPKGYPDNMEVPQYHRRNDAMRPFYEKKNCDGLSNDYTSVWYKYEDSPKKCDNDAQCRSKILWCDKLRYRCKGKIRETGDCTGLPNEACFCPGEYVAPQCVTQYDVGTCKCTKAEQEKVPTLCAASKECRAGEWCDRKARVCQKKVGLNGDCTGMPREACTGPCVLPKLIACVQGRCTCDLIKCKVLDAECISTSLWCNTVKKQCDKKLKIGEKCSRLPDKACKGTCLDNEDLMCQGTCQCVSKDNA